MGSRSPGPSFELVISSRIAEAIRAGDRYQPSALGHPRVWLEIDEHGYVDCGYCDRRFVLRGGPADGANQAALEDISAGSDPGHR